MAPPDESRYTLSEDKKKEYAGLYLLEYMINKPARFPVFLDREDNDLESVFEWLLVVDLVEIRNSGSYVPSEKGRVAIKRFLARYSEYLNVFDVYCGVDLEAGEFAFASYFDCDDEGEWDAFLEEDRWEDLRIAVAEYKKLDPVELVFMSFIAEGRFGRDETGWQFDLLLGSVWDEILEICNNAIHWDQLGYADDEGEDVPADGVIEDIIRQGADLMIRLHQEEAALYADIDHGSNGVGEGCDSRRIGDNDGRVIIETVTVEQHPMDYYYPYRDPFFVAPFLIGALILF